MRTLGLVLIGVVALACMVGIVWLHRIGTRAIRRLFGADRG